jgi:two-component system OmpR family response regulator
VEDEPGALETLLAWMQHQRGWELRSAQPGKNALELSKSFKPEVLITDCLLEDEVTGLEVIAQLKSRRPALPRRGAAAREVRPRLRASTSPFKTSHKYDGTIQHPKWLEQAAL